MKKIGYVLLGLVAFVLVAMILIPILFKGTIQKAVDEGLKDAVNARIYYNPDKFGLSFFKQFPNLTLTLGEFGVAGIGAFEGDTLVDVQSFNLSINLASLFGSAIQVSSIQLVKPTIELLVLKDGTANWDIAKSDSMPEADTTPDEPSTFKLNIAKWEIVDGNILFNDVQNGMLAMIESLNHRGSGDLTATVFDLKTSTLIKGLSYEMANVSYLKQAEVEADLTLLMDMEKASYTFKENKVRLNDFSMGFDGTVSMPADGSIITDVTFESKETLFKNILSLVPGVFMEGFEKIKTDGSLAFNGFVKGTYKDSTSLPGFLVNLRVIDGMVQYPDLPSPISNIQVDFSAGSPNGDMQKLSMELRRFHMDLGEFPVDATLTSEGLMPVTLNGTVDAKVNLEEALRMFPVEGIQMKGMFELSAKANGTYSETSMPALSALLRLENGYIKSADFPAPVESLQIVARAGNPTGKNEDFKALIEQFGMTLEGEKVNASLAFENLDDYTYDLTVNGAVDLAKITTIFPLEGITLSGRVAADIHTAGRMSYIDKQQYDRLPTSGTLNASNFSFVSADLPQGLKIQSANMVFNPKQITLQDFKGSIGRSDLTMDGALSNYLGFALKENEVLQGKLNLYSKKFDVNEWMTEEDSTVAQSATTDTIPMSVVAIPKTIDFTLRSRIDQVVYSNMDITSLEGNIVVKDGTIRLDQTRLSTLGGTITMNGVYDSRTISKPSYAFDLKMDQIAIAKAYETFSVVKAMAPIAQGMSGTLSTDFKIQGELDQTMMPVLGTTTGGGLLNVKQATLKDVKLLSGIADVTKMDNLREIKLSDVLMQAEIRDGRVHLKPFDMQAGGTTMRFSGSSGLDKTMDFDILLPNVKTGVVGQAVNAALSGFLGGNAAVSNSVDITLKALGPFDSPKVQIASIRPSGGGAAPTQMVNDQLNKAKAEAEARIKEEQERLRRDAENKARQEQERLKREAEDRLKREAEDAKKKLKDRFGIPR